MPQKIQLRRDTTPGAQPPATPNAPAEGEAWINIPDAAFWVGQGANTAAMLIYRPPRRQTDQTILADGTATVDWSEGEHVKITAAGNLTLAFSNVPSHPARLTIEAVDWGAGTVTWPGTMQAEGGAMPSLTASGSDYLTIETDGAGLLVLTAALLDIS